VSEYRSGTSITRPAGREGGRDGHHRLDRAGLLAGAIAKAILPGDDPGGIFVTMLIGIVGAIVGGLIASALNIGELGDFFDIGTWLIAIAGSILLLLVYRAVAGRRTT
jgi:uncharacterized membrane protein YeaQ/YmgE (transglycosylase-associated protein family)